VSDLIERAKERLQWATQGRRVQFAPRFCKEAEGTPFSEWDSSHETSVILPDGTRYRGYSVHKHSADAELDNMAPDLARALIDTTAERDALRERVARLEAALRPFANYAAHGKGSDLVPDNHALTQGSRFAARQITMGDMRNARTALQKDTSQ